MKEYLFKKQTTKCSTFNCVSVCGYVHVGMCKCPQKPEEAVGSPGTGVTGCELPKVGSET